MSDPYSPYASTPSAGVMPPNIPQQPPGQIKVFGILHLVFAGLGVLILAVSFLMQGFNERNFAAQEKLGGQVAMQARLTRSMTESMQTYTYVSYGFSLILAILLFIAGRALLKRQRAGLKWSNIYAWSSIGSKIAMIVLSVIFVLPATNKMFEEIIRSSGTTSSSNDTMVSVMKISMTAGVIIGPLVYCVYPVLVLILLNRPAVRNSLQ